MIKLFIHNFRLELFYCIAEYLVSRSLNFRMNEETLTWTQLLFKIHIILFVDDNVRFNICWLDKIYHVGCFYVVVTRESMEILRNKNFNWIKHQVLELSASKGYDNSNQFGILWKNWDIWHNKVTQPTVSSCDEQDCFVYFGYHNSQT